MPTFYSLVDATPGKEADVESQLVARGVKFVRCKEKSHDFMVKFDAPAFDKVDDYLQTHVRSLAGVKGVEIVVDWDDHGPAAREAKAKLG